MKGIEFIDELPSACEPDVEDWFIDEMLHRTNGRTPIEDLFNCATRDAPAEEFKKIVMDALEEMGLSEHFRDTMRNKFNLPEDLIERLDNV